MSTATRFQDNTTTVPVNRVRCYGFAPGLKYMSTAARAAGMAVVEQGCLVLFRPRIESYQTNYAGDTKHYATNEFSARDQALTVVRKYGKSAVGGDAGFRILDMLTALPYDKETGYDAADAYFATVHPNNIAGHVGSCEMGLETNVGGYDRWDASKASDPCPTCRLKWLESDDCAKAIAAASGAVSGQPGIARLDAGILNALRATLIESYKAGLAFAKQRMADIDGEIAKTKAGNPGKAGYDESDFHYMAMLHKKPEYVEQAELVNQQAATQGKAMAEALKDIIAPKESDEVAQMKAQIAELRALVETGAKQPKAKETKE